MSLCDHPRAILHSTLVTERLPVNAALTDTTHHRVQSPRGHLQHTEKHHLPVLPPAHKFLSIILRPLPQEMSIPSTSSDNLQESVNHYIS